MGIISIYIWISTTRGEVKSQPLDQLHKYHHLRRALIYEALAPSHTEAIFYLFKPLRLKNLKITFKVELFLPFSLHFSSLSQSSCSFYFLIALLHLRRWISSAEGSTVVYFYFISRILFLLLLRCSRSSIWYVFMSLKLLVIDFRLYMLNLFVLLNFLITLQIVFISILSVIAFFDCEFRSEVKNSLG